MGNRVLLNLVSIFKYLHSFNVCLPSLFWNLQTTKLFDQFLLTSYFIVSCESKENGFKLPDEFYVFVFHFIRCLFYVMISLRDSFGFQIYSALKYRLIKNHICNESTKLSYLLQLAPKPHYTQVEWNRCPYILK